MRRWLGRRGAERAAHSGTTDPAAPTVTGSAAPTVTGPAAPTVNGPIAPPTLGSAPQPAMPPAWRQVAPLAAAGVALVAAAGLMSVLRPAAEPQNAPLGEVVLQPRPGDGASAGTARTPASPWPSVSGPPLRSVKEPIPMTIVPPGQPPAPASSASSAPSVTSTVPNRSAAATSPWAPTVFAPHVDDPAPAAQPAAPQPTEPADEPKPQPTAPKEDS